MMMISPNKRMGGCLAKDNKESEGPVQKKRPFLVTFVSFCCAQRFGVFASMLAAVTPSGAGAITTSIPVARPFN
jgi:hypothetical protein